MVPAESRASDAGAAVVGVMRVFPDDRGAHPEADAHGRDAVAHGVVFLELPGQLVHEPDARRREGVAHRYGAAVTVDPGVVVGDPEMVQEAKDLDGECLVDFEQADVPDVEAGVRQGFLGGREQARSP